MSKWRKLPSQWSECIICGSVPEIKTNRKDLKVIFENDEIRCSNKECGTKAQVIISEGDDTCIGNIHYNEETSKKYE